MVKRFMALFFVSALLLYISSCLYVSSQPSTTWCPDEGVWFCDELQMQMSFEDDYGTYTIVDGDQIKCCVSNDRGSTHVRIVCQELYHNTYKLDHVFFVGIYVELVSDRFVLKDAKTNKIYTFSRIA